MRSLIATVIGLLSGERRDERIRKRVQLERRERLVAMAQDPVRSKYVKRICDGEHWPDDHIFFNEQRVASGVCAHLLPVEQLMRDRGIDVRPGIPLQIQADCLVNEDAVRALLTMPESVSYSEPHFPERSMSDPRSAMFFCATCTSTIWCVH
ncbi:MAG: hypothetical protein ACO1Q7_16975 [Gemmatimonas sp.]